MHPTLRSEARWERHHTPHCAGVLSLQLLISTVTTLISTTLAFSRLPNLINATPRNIEVAARLNHQQKMQVPHGTGGGERVRTDDPLLAKQVLSQLSYTPVLPVGALRVTAKRQGWWAREDLNLRPHAYQACALTS